MALLWAVATATAVLTAGAASADTPRVSPDTSVVTTAVPGSLLLSEAGAGTTEPTAKPPDPDGELPAWPFAVGAIAAVAVVAIWSVRRRP
ncbi:hypothetical protein [Mycobacterium camsae]|uniref:hypothetical protein n=1 Tax=Mycobacterium gordonae TaxID=1778 RepID=UPI00197F664A|nr:hypothetical protein [Mycobacterium gordonae]